MSATKTYERIPRLSIVVSNLKSKRPHTLVIKIGKTIVTTRISQRDVIALSGKGVETV